MVLTRLTPLVTVVNLFPQIVFGTGSDLAVNWVAPSFKEAGFRRPIGYSATYDFDHLNECHLGVITLRGHR